MDKFYSPKKGRRVGGGGKTQKIYIWTNHMEFSLKFSLSTKIIFSHLLPIYKTSFIESRKGIDNDVFQFAESR